MSYTGDDFLTADRVRAVYAACFRPEAEYRADRPARTQVTGWLARHTFSVPALQRAREDVIKMLLCLPAGFREDEKGGGSVGMAATREDRAFWTGDMSDVEKLIALGMAVGLVSFCAPRESWDRLPGGLPYIRVNITKTGVTVN